MERKRKEHKDDDNNSARKKILLGDKKETLNEQNKNKDKDGEEELTLEDIRARMEYFDWSELERRSSFKNIRKTKMEDIISRCKITEEVKSIEGLEEFGLCLRGSDEECEDLLDEFLLEKMIVACSRERDLLEFFLQKSKKEGVCVGCFSSEKCLYREHIDSIWDPVRSYLESSDENLLKTSENRLVREHHSKMRRVAYQGFHTAYCGPGGPRKQLPDCVEFQIKYWMDSEEYMGFRDS